MPSPASWVLQWCPLQACSGRPYVPALLGPHPEWQGAYDQDGPLAVETRRKLIDRVIAEKMMICGAHFPYPGLGAFAKDGCGYVFTPAKRVSEPKRGLRPYAG
jgi:hypothetical protein